MSTPASISSRGASVLAALVVAAVLASIAMLMQQGSPVAYTQSQTADAAAPQNAVVKNAEQQCLSGFDYKVADTKSSYEITGKQVCPEGSKEAGDSRCTQKNADGTWAKQANWKCKEEYCFTAPADTAKVKKGQSVCTMSESELGDKSFNAIETKASALNTAVAEGKLDPARLPDVGISEVEKSALSDAFSEQGQSLLDKADKINNDYADLQSQYDKKLAELGGEAGLAACTAGAGNGGQDCSGLSEVQALAAAKQAKADELKSLSDQYAKLTDAQQALDAGPTTDGQCTNLSDPNCQNTPTQAQAARCQQDNTLYGCPGYKSANTCTGLCGGNPPPGTGGPGPGNPSGSGNDSSLSKMLQGLGKALGGGGGGSGSGSSQQQQQCQPQYQCSNSAVMYNQCPQQNAQWQTIQQCPTGYSCQNNGCVATAPYGYCTSGQPRTAPPQTQPAATTCTVGTWQDTSNGCQQSWQCIASTQTPTGSTPTAQLSCQPLKAVPKMTITFSYACAGGATASSATGFSIPSDTTLSGNATTSIAKPASGTSVTYALTCTNKSVTPNTTASAQCVVQVASSTIVMVATPEKISKSETDTLKRQSTIGWVTSGMQSCVVSDQDFPEWNNQQANNTSVSGAATSPVITQDTTFLLSCQTLAGTTATSSVKVLAI